MPFLRLVFALLVNMDCIVFIYKPNTIKYRLMKTDKELVIEFAKVWNNLNSSYIKGLLAEDFHYSSQWVFSDIENKKDYLEYLDRKLKAIANSGGSLVAELGIYNDKYCLVLTQDTKVTFLVDTEDGKIIGASTCMIPAPEKVKLLGIIPK